MCNRGLEIVVQVGEDGGDILSLSGADRESASLGNWSRSRSGDGRREGAEREGSVGSDLHEGEHGDLERS